MTTTHTPGPWTQATHSPTDVVANGGTMVAMARDGLNGIARDQAVANARLIAAAPELLAALRALDWAVSGVGYMEEEYAEQIAAARAAIARATQA